MPYNPAYYQLHKAEIDAKNRAWRKANSAKWNRYSEKWRAANPERVAGNAKEWYRHNGAQREKRRKPYVVAYRKANRARASIRTKAWNSRNKPRLRAYEAARRAREKRVTVNPTAIKAFVALLQGKIIVKCYYCQADFLVHEIHVDHVFPLARGGQHEVGNLCAACAPCNLCKKARLISEWNLELQQLLLPL